MLRTLTRLGAPGLVLAACSTGTAAVPSAAAPRAAQPPEPGLAPASQDEQVPARTGSSCPLVFPGAWVGREDVARGAALVFTTSEDIGGLRRRVAELAFPSALQRIEGRLDNIPAGIRIVFEAREARGIPAVRRAVEDEARSIAKDCDMPLAIRSTPSDERATPASGTPAPAPPVAKPKVSAPVKPAPVPAKAKAPPAPTVAPPAAPVPTPPSRANRKNEPPSSLKPRPGERAPGRPGL